MNNIEGQGQKRKNIIFYFILVAMLVFSAILFHKQNTEAVEVGNFGSSSSPRNISFSDLKPFFGEKHK